MVVASAITVSGKSTTGFRNGPLGYDDFDISKGRAIGKSQTMYQG
jgi:hypothetical protein